MSARNQSGSGMVSNPAVDAAAQISESFPPNWLSAQLQPIKGFTTTKDLNRLKEEIALSSSVQSSDTMLAEVSKKFELIPSEMDLSAQPKIVATNKLGVPLPIIGPAESTDLRVFRREIPTLTTQHPASIPLWAAGQKIDHTIGPFRDAKGKLYWFDFYRIVHQIGIIRNPDASPFLTIPLKGIITPKGEYKLSAGSIWMDAKLLTPSAPPSSFVGLKIKGGTIKFDNIVSLVGGNISIGANEHLTLNLLLYQPQADNAVDTKTGADARNLVLTLPQEVTIDFKPLKAEVTKATDANLQIYGNSFVLTKSIAAPYFESIINRIVIPFDNNATTFALAGVQSDQFIAEGTAPINRSGWALSISITTTDKLGEAAGIGAISIETLPELEANWTGLNQGNVALNKTIFLAEPGRIGITAAAAANRRARQDLFCWQESNPSVRSVANLTFSKKEFGLVYNCLSNGSEAFFTTASASCSFDKPLTAANNRLRVETDRALLLIYALKDTTYASLYAEKILEQATSGAIPAVINPASIALTNALLIVSPVDAFLLFGVLEQAKNINKGFVILRQGLYRLIPSLPDPYITNFQMLIQGIRDQFGARSYSNTGYDLASTTSWENPAMPLLSFSFLRDTSVNYTGTIFASGIKNQKQPMQTAQIYPMSIAGNHIDVSKVLQEDQKNEAALDRYLFSSEGAITLLDVSSRADIFGVNLRFNQQIGIASRSVSATNESQFPLLIKGIDLATAATNVQVYTLPQIQWEPIATIQNPNVMPYPFPSPATSSDTGDPTLIATESYQLVPIAPIPVISNLITSYNDPLSPKRAAARFNLPFGMKAATLFADPGDSSKPGSAMMELNQPQFTKLKMTGGIQIKVTASYKPTFPDIEETPGFKGATIQTRNLVDPASNNPLGLSVLGPDVDDIFNQELKPSGFSARVPVHRIDFSGYGATIFSDWLNPKAKISLVSQVKLDILIGRTAHEVVQVKSLLYPWAVPVVRTITIQRTPGGGVTRYDSGWQPQGPGYYDFSYDENTHTKNPDGTPKVIHHANPLEFHPGVVRGIINVNHIRDTGRRYKKLVDGETIILSEVFFNGDLDIENVKLGKFDGYVPSRGQRGYVQISPPGKPLTPKQFQTLTTDEGPLGGPVDCVLEVGNSGQLMRILRTDVNNGDESGPTVFVSAAKGSVVLPKEGSWSVVKRRENTQDIIPIDQESGLPLIRQNGASSSYRFADPKDIFNTTNPYSDYGIMQSTKTQKVLFLRPVIKPGSTNIESDLQPHFADSYAILNSLGIFPSLNDVFKLGPGGSILNVIGPGQLKLPVSFGQLKVPANTQRDLLNTGSSRIYVDYSDGAGATTDISMTIDSLNPKSWTAELKTHSIVVDIEVFKKIITITGDFASDNTTSPGLFKPQVTFGSILKPIMDILKFLGNFDLAQAMTINMSNAKSESWESKWQAHLSAVKLEFPLLEIKVFGKTVKGPTEAESDAFDAAFPLPPIRVDVEFSVGAHYNMLPFSYSTDDAEADIATEKKKMLSAGASLKLEGGLHILCVTVTPALGLYFVGSAELELGIDSQEGKSLGFKVGLGLELYSKLPVVGKVSVYMGLGMEFEFKDTGSGIFALLVFKGEAELLDGAVVIGIHIEAKGGTETEIEAGTEKTYCVCECEFAVEISLLWVINIEFDVTWQEKKQVS